MKSLISVVPREFKRHFGEIMDMCTDMCVAANQEIIITIPEKKNSQTHIEIAKITPVGGGIKYGYNHELLKKFGINTDNRINRIENVIADTFADAFEKSGMAEYARNNKEVADKLQSAMTIAVKELIKQFNL